MTAADARDAATDALAEQGRVDPTRRAERRQRDMEKRVRDAMEKAKDSAPGVGEFAESGVLGAMTGKWSMGEVAARIRNELKARGLSDEEANIATRENINDARRAIGERAMRQAMQGPEISKSETLAASELTRRIQSGVGGEDDWQKRSYEQLAELVRIQRNTTVVRIED